MNIVLNTGAAITTTMSMAQLRELHTDYCIWNGDCTLFHFMSKLNDACALTNWHDACAYMQDEEQDYMQREMVEWTNNEYSTHKECVNAEAVPW